MNPFLRVCGIVGMLAGCSSTPPEKSAIDPSINLSSLDISLDADANHNSATAIDLLVIYKKDLLDAVMAMSAQDYYLSSAQVRRDFPHMVDIWHWELTPGQLVKQYPITLKDQLPVGAVVFADYASPGEHRIRLGNQEKITLRLKREDFCILELGCAGDLNRSSLPKSALPKKSPSLEALKHQLKNSTASQDNPERDAQKMFKEVNAATKQAESLFSKLRK